MFNFCLSDLSARDEVASTETAKCFSQWCNCICFWLKIETSPVTQKLLSLSLLCCRVAHVGWQNSLQALHGLQCIQSFQSFPYFYCLFVHMIERACSRQMETEINRFLREIFHFLKVKSNWNPVRISREAQRKTKTNMPMETYCPW